MKHTDVYIPDRVRRHPDRCIKQQGYFLFLHPREQVHRYVQYTVVLIGNLYPYLLFKYYLTHN